MRNKYIWVFNAGNSFDGNPKWLFLYIVNYVKDIKPYWFCYKQETVDYIKHLGYNACLFTSNTAKKIGAMAGVYVVNQNKEVFQDYFEGITILNLWHGVGCKTVEKKVDFGFLNERIAKKYIQYTSVYKKYELFLVTSPLMEKHFMEQCNLDEGQLIRAGYPCAFYPGEVATYDHDILAQKNLPADTKIAVYAPTYRDASATTFFEKAIPDIDRLIRVLEQENFVLIFKMHPLMNNDFYYQNLRRKYQDCSRLIFWDNLNDLYEIFDKIELAIVDYSSIFYDMLARGVKNFARYIFDYGMDNTVRDFALDYKENTYGEICSNFDEFLHIFSDYQDDKQERARIYDRFWSYADENSLQRIVDTALAFEPDESRVLPTLYSFDIFDTLIGRTTLRPAGVFRYVQDKMLASSLHYPKYFQENFHKIRPWAEQNMREYYRKTVKLRNSTRTEITFDMIYERIQELYELSDEQINQLKEWELECEYKTSIPYTERIELIKELLANQETVVLISDMYLPKEFVQKLLAKADPVLATLPLFLSSDYGTQKTTRALFLDVYHSLDYSFGKWIHYGDSANADGSAPRRLAIETVNHTIPQLNKYEDKLNLFIGSYDAYQVSALFARFRAEEHTSAEIYAYCYVSLYWVPYVSWAIRHAMERGVQCLYFISRDGYHLKRIADAIIASKNLNVKTKYIYGSRKVWRIPSQIGEIDEEFFGGFGNFVGVDSYEKLLEAGAFTEEEFLEMFPELAYLKEQKHISIAELNQITELLRFSEKYREHLLKVAAERREIVLDYLKQEMDLSEKFAFVEFWGRGYTQTCLAKLIWELEEEKSDNIFYYARSIYPSEGKLIRYNFTGNTYSYIFIEAIFANLPYQSVAAYEERDGRIEPVLKPAQNNAEVHEALEQYLPAFTKDFCQLQFEDERAIERSLFDYSLSYFHLNGEDKIFTSTMATLQDSVTLYGDRNEYAPPITLKVVFKRLGGEYFDTRNLKLSLAASPKVYRKIYEFYHNKFRTKGIGRMINQLYQKISDKRESKKYK